MEIPTAHVEDGYFTDQARCHVGSVSPRLLMAGEPVIDVFADASVHDGLGIGSWACRVPAFNVDRSGFEWGGHIERLELAGAVNAIETAAALDYSSRPIRVNSDSDFAISVLTRVAANSELPPRRSYQRVSDLTERAAIVLGTRNLICVYCNGKSPDHLACHLSAIGQIRRHIQNDGRARMVLAIRRQEQAVSRLLKLRIKLEEQIRQLDEKIAAAETSLCGLRELGRLEGLSLSSQLDLTPPSQTERRQTGSSCNGWFPGPAL